MHLTSVLTYNIFSPTSSLLSYESPAKEPLLAGASDDEDVNEEKEHPEGKVNLNGQVLFAIFACLNIATKCPATSFKTFTKPSFNLLTPTRGLGAGNSISKVKIDRSKVRLGYGRFS